MPMTPQDVQNKLFTSVRYRRGYDEDEVDAFLDEVEAELRRNQAEVARLRAELDEARARLAEVDFSGPSASGSVREPGFFAPPAHEPGSAVPAAPTPDAVTSTTEIAAVAENAPAAAGPDAVPAPEAAPVPLGEPSPTEDVLRRTLILAQRTADAAVAEAKAEADAIVSSAREQAEVTERNAAREFAVRQRERQDEYDSLSAAVEELRGFEQEYRSRLRAYLHLQLRDLDSSAPAEPPALRGTAREAIAPPESLEAAEPAAADDGAREIERKPVPRPPGRSRRSAAVTDGSGSDGTGSDGTGSDADEEPV